MFGGVSAGSARSPRWEGRLCFPEDPGLAYWASPQNVGNYPRREVDGRRAWDRAVAAWKTPGGEEKGP